MEWFYSKTYADKIKDVYLWNKHCFVKKIEIEEVELWQYSSLLGLGGQRHFVSGRKGGVSQFPYDSLNLSYSAGDERDNVQENRNRLAKSLGIAFENLVFVSQIHSNKVVVVKKPDDTKGVEADAMVTDVPGLCISVMGADCVPIIAYDPVKNVAGAAHAGWRGTLSSITTQMLHAMIDTYRCLPSDIYVGIGPSASQQRYEVGEDVFLLYKKAFDDAGCEWFKYDKLTNKYFPDLWLANKSQAMWAGVLEHHIEVAGICTMANPNDFFSARLSNNRTGRFASGIVLC